MIIDEIKESVNEFVKIDPNMDDLVKEYMDKWVSLLTKSLSETLYFLDNADEDTIFYTCTTWETISSFFKSNELIMHMGKCVDRFLNNSEILRINLDYAKEAAKK